MSCSRNGLLGGEASWGPITVAGYAPAGNEPGTFQDWVGPGFFSTAQIPLVAGREFTEEDRFGAQEVAVVDEAFVNHYSSGDVRAALAGSFGFAKGESSRSFGGGKAGGIQIVGVVPVVRDTKLIALPSKLFFYLPYDQTYTDLTKQSSWHQANFYLRVTGDVSPNAIRKLVHEIDPNLPVIGLQTMDERISDSIFETRLMTALAISISALALLLAAIGLYGILAFSVAQRTKEIGIRMALGASRGEIYGLVIRQVGYLIAAGLAVGTALGWLAVRILRSEVSGLQRSPLWLFPAAAFALIALMLIAGYLPARRASSVQPMQALRAE